MRLSSALFRCVPDGTDWGSSFHVPSQDIAITAFARCTLPDSFIRVWCISLSAIPRHLIVIAALERPYDINGDLEPDRVEVSLSIEPGAGSASRGNPWKRTDPPG